MASVNFKTRLHSRGPRSTIVLGVLCAFFAFAAIILVKFSTDAAKVRSALVPVVTFDPNACLRLRDFSRVYSIKSAPNNPDVVWFCGGEGLRILDVASVEWKRFGLEHGLPSEEVTGVAFDHGRAWVGTAAGIAVFDSSRGLFVPPKNGGPAQGSRVLAIESIPGGGIWFSVEGKGLFSIGGGDSIRAVVAGAVDSVHNVTCIRPLANGSVLLGLAGSIIETIDPKTLAVTTCRFEREVSSTTEVWDAVELPGAVYVGTSNDGIWTAPSFGDTLHQLKSNPAKGAYAFAPDSDGFWCGTPFGLWRYYRSNDAWVQFVNPEEREPTDFQVFCLLNTPRRVWYGTQELGAGYFDKERGGWQHLRAGLSKPNVAAIAASADEVWTGYGYQGNGLDRFSVTQLELVRNYGHSSGVGDANIQSLLFVDSTLYYGGYEGFGSVGSHEGVQWFGRDAGLPAGDVAAIVCDQGDHLLLASLNGVIDFNRRDRSFRALEATMFRRITALLPLRDSLWYGTLGQGAFMFDRKKGTNALHVLEKSARIVSIDTASFGDSAGLAVVTKDDGLFGVDRTSGRTWPLALPPSIGEGGWMRDAYNVMAAKTIGRHVWVGTRAAGCLVFDLGSRSWATFTTSDGLVANRVRSIAESEKYIWIGMYGGLNRLDKTYIDTVLIRKFKELTPGR